jgi:hypothetical protein
MAIPFTREDTVRSRFVELGQQFEIFQNELQRLGYETDIEVDPSKLYLVVTSYFIDIARYKWWHFPDDPESALLDETKKAAYFAYWLNKIAPVSTRRAAGSPAPILDLNGLPSDISVMATQLFTIFVISTYLNFALSDDLMAKLLYHMLWRDETAKGYLLLFEMLTAAKGGEALFASTSL